MVYDWPVLVGAGERVRYMGDAVAIVAAETRAIATQALDLIEVDYEPHPVISDPVQSLKPDTESLHPSGNLLKHIKVQKGTLNRVLKRRTLFLSIHFIPLLPTMLLLNPNAVWPGRPRMGGWKSMWVHKSFIKIESK